MIEYPTSLEDPRLDVYARLTELQLRNKLEPEKGIFIAESDKVIDRALAAGYQPISLLVPEHRFGRHYPPYQRGRRFPQCCGVGGGCGFVHARML